MKFHLKRIAAPKSWLIKRKGKGKRWLIKSNPGAHRISRSVPLALLIRDMLKYAKTMKEAKNIITKKQVIVNGRRIKEYKMPVGLMDAVSFPDADESFRILINKKGKLFAKKIEKKTDAEIKPFKIKNKNKVKGKIQLNLSSGNNILVDKDNYKTGDTLILAPKNKEIKHHLKLEKGSLIYLTGGRRIGETGVIDSIEGEKILLKINEQQFETLKKYAFVIGKDKPVIEL